MRRGEGNARAAEGCARYALTARKSPVAVGPEPIELLRAEARALLEAAEARRPVEVERLRAFARAFLEADELGRLALAVLDGGLFAGRRALELAAALLEAEPANVEQAGEGGA